MKLTIALAAVLAFIFASPQSNRAYAQDSAGDTSAVRAQIEANNRAVGRAIGTMDFGTLEKLWAPGMVVNSPGNNILTRQQVFGAMREDKLKYSSVKGTIESFFVAKDVAVEMGYEDIVMANGPMAGKPLKRRYTNVWQKSGDGWVQIARQATYIGIDGGAVYGHPDIALSH
jgi:ketosteroid isomerase-like protein